MIHELAGAFFTAAEAARVMGRNEMSVFNRAEKINVQFGGDAVSTFRRMLRMGQTVRRCENYAFPGWSVITTWTAQTKRGLETFPVAYMDALCEHGLLINIDPHTETYRHIDAQTRFNHERDEHLGIR